MYLIAVIYPKTQTHSCNYNKERQQYIYFCFGAKFALV